MPVVNKAAKMNPTETLEQRFCRLDALWRKETAYQSSSTKIKNHPAFREVVALGDTAVPLLFDSFLLLLLIRFLFGAGEAGALPNAARVVACWFPPDGRGPAQGLINTAALIGGAVAPVIAAYTIKWGGWRWLSP